MYSAWVQVYTGLPLCSQELDIKIKAPEAGAQAMILKKASEYNQLDQ